MGKLRINRVWIIGFTNSGKSTFAKNLSDRLNIPVLEAGKYCRAICHEDADAEFLSIVSGAMLRKDHKFFSRKIKKDSEGKRLIISGIRNPVDFIDSFNPEGDYVFFLDSFDNAASLFEEKGIKAISSLLSFFLSISIIEERQVQILIADKTKDDWYDEIYSKIAY